MTKPGHENLQRELRGCIVTLSDGSVIQRSGTLHEALTSVARYCDAWDLTVVSISTPATIRQDLQGDRINRVENNFRGALMFPEPNMLAKIGRKDLLAPSLRRQDERTYRAKA